MRVAVIGANGQLGTDVCKVFRESGHDVIELNHAELDVRDAASVQRTMQSAAPQLVVNTAALHNLEQCEAAPQDSAAVNALGPRNLAAAGGQFGYALMHVSTDYVFDGSKGKPYVEHDRTNPLSVYGRTKLQGEDAVRETLARHFIVRTSGLYGSAPCRAKPSGNFVQLMLRLARERGEVRVVTDEIVTPTYTADLARQMVRIVESGRHGLYHATSQGETSWYDFASRIFELTGTKVKMHEAGVADFPQKAPRPKYSVLDNAELRSARLDIMPHWSESLAKYIHSMN